MPVPRHRDIRIGTPVSIVLKADQRTGRQVQGTVTQLLTRGDHPRGVKVRLTDGRIGRVQQLTSAVPSQPSSTSFPTTPSARHQYHSMNPEHNPWQSSASQGNPYLSQQDRETQGQQNPSGQAAQYYGGGGGGGGGGGYNQQPQQQQQYQQYQQQPPPPPQQQQPNQGYYNQHPTPAQSVQRTETDTLLAQQGDRAEQLEHMQNYEASAPQTTDDRNQAQLQKEFPNVDSSLIAALYGDTKDLSATREMLQELARDS